MTVDSGEVPAKPGIATWPARIREYFGDLRGEMRRVTWPTRDQVITTTAVVIVAVFAFAAYFWAVDLILGSAITRVFSFFTK
jgi:preprotein translocase subunit SecE